MTKSTSFALVAAVLAIGAFIVLGPIATDAIQNHETKLERSTRHLNESMERLREATEAANF